MRSAMMHTDGRCLLVSLELRRILQPISWAGCTGKPVAFKLMPANTQPLLAAEDSTAYSRAGFSRNALWVTQADDSHRWPGGDYPLQNPNPGGLQDWVHEVLPHVPLVLLMSSAWGL